MSRLVNALKDWLRYESQSSVDRPVVVADSYRRGGIPVILEPLELSYWERTSRPLELSEAYRPILLTLRDYLAQEIEAVDDDSLDQEVDLLDLILAES